MDASEEKRAKIYIIVPEDVKRETGTTSDCTNEHAAHLATKKDHGAQGVCGAA